MNSKDTSTGPAGHRCTKILAAELIRMRFYRSGRNCNSLAWIAAKYGRTEEQVAAAIGTEILFDSAHGCAVRRRCDECGVIVFGHCFGCLSVAGYVYDPMPTAEVAFEPGSTRNVDVLAFLPDRSEFLVSFRASGVNLNFLRTLHWLPADLVRELPRAKYSRK